MHTYSVLILLVINLACSSDFTSENEMIAISDSALVANHNTTNLEAIPLRWIDSAKVKLHIRYGNASHGGQVTSGGMMALTRFSDDFKEQYAFGPEDKENSLHMVETDDELSHYDNWDEIGRDYLDSHPECNVVMWSWCGILSEDVDHYLATMEELIAEYGPNGTLNRPNPVQFVFMTAHSYAYTGNKEAFDSNNKIREHCKVKNRIMFDFNDIECFDPDGNYFGDGKPDGTYAGTKRLNDDVSYDVVYKKRRGNWGIDWMAANPDSYLTKLAEDNVCTVCAHSMGEDNDANSRLHCVLKGIAAWWLWARLAGWDGKSS